MTFEIPITVSCAGSLDLQSDSDEDGQGTLSFSSVASITVTSSSVNQVVLTGADLILEPQLQALSANVTVRVSSHGGSALGVGGNYGGMHLSGVELNRITTTSTLTLGSVQTDQVILDGVNYEHKPVDIFVISMNSIDFKGGSSSFLSRVGIRADNDITTGSLIRTNGGSVKIVADAACDGTGTFKVTSSGSVTTSSNYLIIEANDAELAGRLDSGYAATRFVGCAGVPIGAGGTGAHNGQTTLSQAELQQTNSHNLSFTAMTDNVRAYKTVAADTEKIMGRVCFQANHYIAFHGSPTFKATRATWALAPGFGLRLVTLTWSLSKVAAAACVLIRL